jgi:hypothetical protein
MRFLSLARRMRRTVAFVAGCLMSASGVNGQQAAGRVKSDLQLRIEANGSSFHAGEPILLRLTVVNASDHPTELGARNHTGLAEISVYDSTGKELQVTGQPIGGRGGGPPHTLEAGSEIRFAYPGYPEGWFDLRDWGFELWKPGSYTIADPWLNSNRVRITVVERLPGTDSAAIAQDYYDRRKAGYPPHRPDTARAVDTRAAAWAKMDSIRAWKQARDSSRKE